GEAAVVDGDAHLGGSRETHVCAGDDDAGQVCFRSRARPQVELLVAAFAAFDPRGRGGSNVELFAFEAAEDHVCSRGCPQVFQSRHDDLPYKLQRLRAEEAEAAAVQTNDEITVLHADVELLLDVFGIGDLDAPVL